MFMASLNIFLLENYYFIKFPVDPFKIPVGHKVSDMTNTKTKHVIIVKHNVQVKNKLHCIF